jgi:O-antigen/teichoic acid export membrane protein
VNSRFFYSMLLGGGAFGSLMVMSAELGILRDTSDVGEFLLFYSVIYLAGQILSLGGYQRAPYFVVNNGDFDGRVKNSRTIEALLSLSVVVISTVAFLLRDYDGVAMFCCGSALVAIQFLISGLANGLGRFFLSRLNMIVIPNAIFCIIVPFSNLQPTLLYCFCLSVACSISIVYLRLLGWRISGSVLRAADTANLLSPKSIFVVTAVSCISQIDLWIVSAFVSPENLSLYAFSTRMVALLTFPVTSYINAVQPVLARLISEDDSGPVREIFGRSYRRVLLMVLILSLIAPIFGAGWSVVVFGMLHWQVVITLFAVSAGYLASAVVPPFEALAYASGEEQRYFVFVCLVVALQVAFSLSLVWAGAYAVVPLVAGASLSVVRRGMRPSTWAI